MEPDKRLHSDEDTFTHRAGAVVPENIRLQYEKIRINS